MTPNGVFIFPFSFSFLNGEGCLNLEHLQKEGREGDELPHCLAQTQQSPDAAQAQREVARGGH